MNVHDHYLPRRQDGDAIRRIRTAKGMSRQELAEQTGAGFSTIKNVELGVQNASRNLVRRISGALDCAPTDIMSDTGRADFYARQARNAA